MTADATAASVPHVERTRPAIHRAGRVAIAGGLVGLAAQLLFFDVGLGINAPIGLGLLLAAGWIARHPAAHISRVNAWIAPAAVAFAAFAAVRADRSIVALDLLTALGLGGAALLTFGGRDLVRTTVDPLARHALAGIGWVVIGIGPVLAAARRELPAGGLRLDRWRPAAQVLRGLLIAVPVLVAFVTLFAAADAVFAQLVDDAFDVRLDLGDIPGRLLLAGIVGWLATGAIALAAMHPDPTDRAEPAGGARLVLGTTETLTVLACVLAVFALFVALQGAYLFGGLDTLAATGLTYAEYARRGFFELVAVAILAGGLIVVLDRVVRRRTRAVVGSSVALAALTAVVLVSAAFRMRLYQEAYGWTELRLYVLATILLLGVVLVLLVGALLTDRVRWIGHAIVATGLVVGLGLNLVGPVRFITEQNVARALDPGLVPAHGTAGLDVGYVGSLDLDAVPILVDALPDLPAATADRVRDALSAELSALRADHGGWQAWNAGRSAALDALREAQARGELDGR